MRGNMQAVRRAMQQMLPLVLVLTWLYLMQQLFLRPDGYFAVTLGYGCHIMSSFGEINRVMTLFLDKGFQIMGVLVIVLAIQISRPSTNDFANPGDISELANAEYDSKFNESCDITFDGVCHYGTDSIG